MCEQGSEKPEEVLHLVGCYGISDFELPIPLVQNSSEP